ncbi:MAG TPA: ribosome maturation factor RimM [Gemmatimonadaceae bacterium]|nr:ribosome maturation factor RimM [Gemmatimonadaceae bacterium]
MTSPASELVIVGRVRKAHGIRGELVVEPITDEPDAVFAPGRRVFAGTRSGDVAPDRRELHVERSSPFKGGLIVAFRDIADRTAAELWRDRYLLAPREELPALQEGEVYLHELPGMQVLLASGESLGRVVDTFDLPQGLAIDVKLDATGKTLMLLYDQCVVDVDRTARRITVEVPAGMLD